MLRRCASCTLFRSGKSFYCCEIKNFECIDRSESKNISNMFQVGFMEKEFKNCSMLRTYQLCKTINFGSAQMSERQIRLFHPNAHFCHALRSKRCASARYLLERGFLPPLRGLLHLGIAKICDKFLIR